MQHVSAGLPKTGAAFEEAGLVQRGADFTLEATILLNQSLETILADLANESERETVSLLFNAIGAKLDKQATYHAARVYRETRLDPRVIDPMLTRLAERDLLLYRPYSRGVTLRIGVELSDLIHLKAIEQRFDARYERFEERLQKMQAYIQLQRGQNRCRSAYLVNYLTGDTTATPCGKCNLCSPTNENLPWRSDLLVAVEPLRIDPRLAVLGAVKDHNNAFGRGTFVKMLLGTPLTSYQGNVKPFSAKARSSDHFGELEGTGVKADDVEHALDALINSGYLQLLEHSFRDRDGTYKAVTITQQGRDALAGGIDLPASQIGGGRA